MSFDGLHDEVDGCHLPTSSLRNGKVQAKRVKMYSGRKKTSLYQDIRVYAVLTMPFGIFSPESHIHEIIFSHLIVKFLFQSHIFNSWHGREMLSPPGILVFMLRSPCHSVASASSHTLTRFFFHI